jgi:hypothetical protein
MRAGDGRVDGDRVGGGGAEVGVGCADLDGRRIVTIDGDDWWLAGGTCCRCGYGRWRFAPPK